MAPREAVVQTLDTETCRPGMTWTTGNVAEAFPGVFTTFGFSYIHEPMELAFRRMFVRLGVFPPSEVRVPEDTDDMFWTVFAGRAAANIDKFREIAGLTPGTSATAVEQQLFGYVRPETVDDNSRRRYPRIFAKAPAAVVTLPRRHDVMVARLRRWRLDQLGLTPGLDEAGCLGLLADARRRFEEIMVLHLIVAFVSSGLADRLAEMVTAAGLEGLEARLLSGVGSDENEVAHDLWALAHGELDLAAFNDRHGYHGPNEGQLSGVSWREDPSPVLARLEDYRAIAADSPRAPRRRSAEQEAIRRRATAELAACVPALRRRTISLTASLAARFLALREQGKAGYLLTFDVARAAARRLGALLVERGVLETAEDVFHFAYEELRAQPGAGGRVLVTERAKRYAGHTTLRLPKSWTGLLEPTRVGSDAGDLLLAGEQITGVAASGGVVEGRARVVRDPGATELDDGDILVCETTDPSWVSLFLVAGGVVTDHGGLLSHGSIVARELGIPCVCGTGQGSHRIVDGQRLRLDGDRGVVEVLG